LEVLDAVADALIPATPRLASASQVAGFHRWLEVALTARVEQFDSIVQCVEDLDLPPDDDMLDQLRSLSAFRPETFRVLSSVVAGAYLMIPEVKQMLGYPGPERYPTDVEEAVHDMADGILLPVIERGSVG
jgi:hypothetical protein